MPKILIAVDGMPGTGKTTLCKALAQSMGIRYTKEPYLEKDWEGSKFLLYNPKHSQRTRAFLMMAQRSSHLEDLKDEPVALFDRYILTTVGHQARTLGESHLLYQYQRFYDFQLPTLQIYLKADRATRISRMEGREDNDELDEMNTDSLDEHFQHGLKQMLNAGVRVVILNTTESTFSECFTLLQSEIKEILDGDTDLQSGGDTAAGSPHSVAAV